MMISRHDRDTRWTIDDITIEILINYKIWNRASIKLGNSHISNILLVMKYIILYHIHQHLILFLLSSINYHIHQYVTEQPLHERILIIPMSMENPQPERFNDDKRIIQKLLIILC